MTPATMMTSAASDTSRLVFTVYLPKWRGRDLNPWLPAYEAGVLPSCTTPLKLDPPNRVCGTCQR